MTSRTRSTRRTLLLSTLALSAAATPLARAQTQAFPCATSFAAFRHDQLHREVA